MPTGRGFISVLLILFFAASASAGPAVLPEIELPATATAAESTYLGVPPGKAFLLSAISSTVLVVEVFSTFCGACRKESPKINELYTTIAASAELSPMVKIIGIGIGNDEQEVRAYQQQHATPFPLFADKKVMAMKKLGAMGTPTFLILQRQADGTMVRCYVKTGPLGAPDRFLEELRKAAGR